MTGMESVLLLIVIFAPPIVGYILRKTRLWWLPGAALLVGAFVCFAGLDTTSHGEDAALAGLGNFGVLVASGVLLIYGVMLLWITSGAHERALRRPTPPPPSLPVATVVTMSKR